MRLLLSALFAKTCHDKSFAIVYHVSVCLAPTLPPGKCALDVADPVTLADGDYSGYYFGAYPNSRSEYQSLTKFVRIR